MRHRLTLCENLIRCLYCGSVFAAVEAAAEECPRSRKGRQKQGRIVVDEIRERIERELASALDRLNQLGGAVVVEEFPGAVGDNGPVADPADRGQIHEEWEIILATRTLLVERANRLAEALERLRRSGYGICEECGEAIAPARLQAMPEVTTCVRCQDRLERKATQGRVSLSS
jgi:DnaK suppressor protein